MQKPSDYMKRTGILKVSAPGFDLSYHIRVMMVRQDDDKLRLLVANAVGGSQQMWVDADKVLFDEDESSAN